MFRTLGTSWEFATTAYSIIWHNKSLLVFPILSGIAAALVIASFALPLWSSGTLELWMQAEEQGQQAAEQNKVAKYATLFAFYFCNYFVIVFFNCALIASAMKVLNGEEASVTYGIAIAAQRLPQIIAWALVSAVVGVVLRVIENANKRVGAIVSAVLGMAWTVLTYFVVPVIVMESAGPVKAFKRSASTLKSTWGEALMGHFSLGFIGFLVTLPVVLLAGVLVYFAGSTGSAALTVFAIAVGVIGIMLAAAASAAADTVFKAMLFSYATGQDLPPEINPGQFEHAFGPKEER